MVNAKFVMTSGVALVAALFLSGCGGDAGGSKGENGVVVTLNGKDNQATTALRDFFQRTFVDCEGTLAAQAYWGTGFYQYVQFKDMDIAVLEQDVSAAERANGAKYVGHVEYGPDAIMREKFGAGEWSPWEPLSGTRGDYKGRAGEPLYKVVQTADGWDMSLALPILRNNKVGVGTGDYWSKPNCSQL